MHTRGDFLHEPDRVCPEGYDDIRAVVRNDRFAWLEATERKLILAQGQGRKARLLIA